MKLTLKRTAISLALAGSFTLTGCNFIGDGDPVFVEPTDPVTQSITVEGEATKGALIGADVFACIAKTACSTADVNDIRGATGFVGETVTDTNGEYTLNITNTSAFGKVIVVRIIANSTSSMDCDVYDDAGNEDCSFALDGTELKTIAVAPVPAEGETSVALPDVDASALSTITVELMEADETLTESTTAAELSTKAKAASKGVATILGLKESDIGADVDFTKLKLGTAKQGNAKFVALSDAGKKLASVNAALGGLAASGENLGQKIKEVATTIKSAVQLPSAVNDAVVTIVKNVATVVKAQVTQSSTKTNTTAPTTKNPDTVTVDTVKNDAQDAREAIVEGGGNPGGTGGTGSTGGGNTGGSNT
ncbi:hypothetical protein DS2_11188 [Catenovulum agarivorans DS-2]|uniref:Lipoprotein n=1 Tax=Catenovulum agarivorans DS-2 TaxID=1328313 RepID=W7QL95_9ALTE|nr:hypothetical protein [Catenovulum agarivorans]EWH09692.1 hypothetical protein DS2_11188 [Catenovulum agarivorans DS-2]